MEHPFELFDYDQEPRPVQLTDEQLAEKYKDPDEIEEQRIERMSRLEATADNDDSFL